MTDPLGRSSDRLFSGTAWHYARYRPGYPRVFFDDLVEWCRLDSTGRLLDLGCGTGQLTLPLAKHVAEAVGVDPESEMLTEAARQADEAGVANVIWAQASSADLPGEFGRFKLVTMGRSFHWMDREQVLEALDGMVDYGGGVVIANDSCLVRPATTWQRAIEDIQHRFLPSEPAHGSTAHTSTACSAAVRSHEEILARSPFQHTRRLTYAFERRWTVEQAIGYLYSTSLPLSRLLGDRRTAFEHAITDTLCAIEPKGRFIEPVTLDVITAGRE